MPELNRSSTTSTGHRIPRMHGFPWQMVASIVMRLSDVIEVDNEQANLLTFSLLYQRTDFGGSVVNPFALADHRADEFRTFLGFLKYLADIFSQE